MKERLRTGKKNRSDFILSKVAVTLKKELGKSLKAVILFGSRARGDFYPESDYDLLILVSQETKRLKQKIFKITCKIGWEHNVIISPIVHGRDCFERRIYEPLFMNVRKEGIYL